MIYIILMLMHVLNLYTFIYSTRLLKNEEEGIGMN